MLSEISQTQKNKYYTISLILESKKFELIEAESESVIARGSGEWGRRHWETMVKGYKLLVIR